MLQIMINSSYNDQFSTEYLERYQLFIYYLLTLHTPVSCVRLAQQKTTPILQPFISNTVAHTIQ